jgi:ribosomal protein S18 acetylase RimI-like enzyme
MSITRAVDLSLTALAELFTKSFEGYLLPIHVTAEGLAQRIRVEHVDLFASRVVMLDDVPMGLGLIARRGRQSRVASMGLVPAARSRGLGRALIATLVDDARARGDRGLRLEVFEQNAPAVAVYQRAGFRVVRRLVSYEIDRLEADATPLAELDPDAFGRAMQRDGALDLPWQLSPDTLAFAGPPTRVFSSGSAAFASIIHVSDESIVLRGIFTKREERRRGHAARLLRGLAGLFPGRTPSFPALVPEDATPEFFGELGFRRGPPTQLEMLIEP